MGKKRGSSWFAFVKRAFCSPTKGCNKKNSRKRGATEHQDDQDKKGDKGRWVTQCQHSHEKMDHKNKEHVRVDLDTTRVLVAEAAAATAQAAAEIARVTHRSILFRRCYNAAVVIQAAFRGYLARRALRALKGIVKLQAVIRGHNVRKQAKLTLRCVQALIRLQAQMCDQQARLSHDRSRKSMFAESNNLWDRYKQDIRQRKSTSAGRSSTTDEWDFFPYISEDDEIVFKTKNDASLKREKALAYALSQQLRRLDSDMSNRSEWLSRWMATKQWDSFTMRDSTERRDSIRSVQPSNYEFLSKSRHSLSHPPSSTPSSCRARPLQMRSASPRCLRDERSHSTANTPTSAGSKYSCISGLSDLGAATPRYMIATESAKAKARSASMLNQRPSTQGRERVRKRLSYPVNDQHCSDYADNTSFSQCLRSPSFKSLCPELERGAYPDSYYGEISPASTTHIRRWLN